MPAVSSRRAAVSRVRRVAWRARVHALGFDYVGIAWIGHGERAQAGQLQKAGHLWLHSEVLFTRTKQQWNPIYRSA